VHNGRKKAMLAYESGALLLSTDVLQIEENLRRMPSKILFRLKLLRFYSHNDSPMSTNNWIVHVTWMIENRASHWMLGQLDMPASITPKQFQTLVDLWTFVCNEETSSATKFGRAGQFIANRNGLAAINFLLIAEKLAPTCIEWSASLLDIYLDRGASGQDEDTTRVFSQGEKMLLIEKRPGEINGLLTRLCDFALKMNQLVKAATYADALLNLAIDRRISQGEFVAHCRIGLIASRQGDLARAQSELTTAEACEFFPHLSLVNELLDLGLTDFVLNFLRICALRSTIYGHSIEQCIRQLETGERTNLSFEQFRL
jgi:hypothetical protein